MGIFNAYEAAKRAFQDVVSPDLQFLRGQLQAVSAEVCRPNEKIDSKHAEVLSEIRRLDGRIDSLDEKIDSRHAEVLSEFRRLDEKIDSTARRLDKKIDSLDKKIDFAIRFHERLARVEAKLDLSAP